jgi:virulence-associated protein VapD
VHSNDKETNSLNSKKVVNFDLNINAVKLAIAKGEAKFKSHTTAYDKIRRFLTKSGFEHEQGSAYISKDVMSLNDTRTTFFKLGEKNPWLVSCMPKCRLSSFEDGALTYTDLMTDIKNGANTPSGDMTSVPSNYKPTRNPREKAQADALRETLRGGTDFTEIRTAHAHQRGAETGEAGVYGAAKDPAQTGTPPAKNKG